MLESSSNFEGAAEGILSNRDTFEYINSSKAEIMDACIATFDKDCDGNLNPEEFMNLCTALFRDSSGNSYQLSNDYFANIFNIFDSNNDGYIDRNEFTYCWHNWIKIIVRPISALLIVDVQNDFICGSLDIRNCPAKHNGEEIIKPINNLLNTVEFDMVYYSYDWHPSDHVSFIDNIKLRKLSHLSAINADKAKVYDTVIFDGTPPIVQKLWPRHCVQNTWGSELHKDLKIVKNGVKVYKGTNPDIDSYSLFWDNQKLAKTKLDSLLKQRNITDLYVVGVAYDVCVAYTVTDALNAGYRVSLLDDCSRGVDLLDIEKTKKYIRENHGLVIDSSDVKAMVKGLDRKPELGYKLALEIKKNRNSPK